MKRTVRLQYVQDEATLADLTVDTTLDLATFMARLPAFLQEDGANSISPASRGFPATAIGRRYLPLAEHLYRSPEHTLRLSFTEIESLLKAALPATARGAHARSWWANTDTHSQGKAWLSAGWRVVHIDPEGESVEFRRDEDVRQ